jgi:hypothetical protein
MRRHVETSRGRLYRLSITNIDGCFAYGRGQAAREGFHKDAPEFLALVAEARQKKSCVSP